MKNRGLVIALASVVALFVLGAMYTAFRINNRELSEAARKINPQEIQQRYTESEVWGKYYPRHWESFNKGFQEKDQVKYGASKRLSKLEEMPYLKKLYAGTGYAEEFYEPRAHVYAVQDIGSISPKRKKTGGACLTCKATEVPDLIKKYGDKFYSAPFPEMYKMVKHPIGCSDCHDPKTNALRISRPALIKAFQRQGKDVTKASRQEMRSLVCAQCHVTYYFLKDTKETTFPWDKGLKADQVLAYYDQKKFTEFTHPESQSPLLKARHPDYEIFLGSTHQAAGVACADCHMPYVKVGDSKISSHWFTSPVSTINYSCTKCHRESADYLKNRVATIQNRHKQLLDIGANTLVQVIDEIKKTMDTPGADQKGLEEARKLHREAQWMWDWVATANSMGFHNPQEGALFLGKSIDLGHKAIAAARKARGAQQ
ncbi:ammonia-forming cytochrome c nitrite reductase subunit c552 [Desulfotomaculum nigrificans]|uniref:ammonia-forming cytochrome c nitrite reductase subunit c552 n=1 Tax=Desulfotomaculum nigrificans TaxID=1565 RepID=UPI0001FAEEBF|nr:ammonia-forming cytochrome c nitrite reductase subunit c552 [Desulfotomaculum nigrificans]